MKDESNTTRRIGVGLLAVAMLTGGLLAVVSTATAEPEITDWGQLANCDPDAGGDFWGHAVANAGIKAHTHDPVWDLTARGKVTVDETKSEEEHVSTLTTPLNRLADIYVEDTGDGLQEGDRVFANAFAEGETPLGYRFRDAGRAQDTCGDDEGGDPDPNEDVANLLEKV